MSLRIVMLLLHLLLCFAATRHVKVGDLAKVQQMSDFYFTKINHKTKKAEWERWKDGTEKGALPDRALGVVFSSKPNQYSKYIYYWDFYSGMVHQPGIVHCGFLDHIEWEKCMKLPIVLMVLPQVPRIHIYSPIYIGSCRNRG
jgi:hypothetical protein